MRCCSAQETILRRHRLSFGPAGRTRKMAARIRTNACLLTDRRVQFFDQGQQLDFIRHFTSLP